MQAILPTSIAELNPIETVTFIQRAVTTATWVWDTIWEKGSLVAHALIFVFFRVLGLVFPGAFLFEVITCHAIAVIQGKRSTDKIEILETRNKDLTKDNDKLTRAAIRTQIIRDRLIFERNQSATERDVAQNEREQTILGRAALTYERDQLRTQVENLQRTVAEMESAANIADQNANALQAEKLQLEQTVANLNRDLQQTNGERLLSEQLTRIDKAHQQVQLANPQSKELLQRELTLLLPLYEHNKQEYREMLQSCIDDYNELDPARIPLQGLISLSLQESGHQTRISQLIDLLKDKK